MKKKAKKIKAIKKLVKNFSGIQKEPYGNRMRKTISIEVSSNEDITSYISPLHIEALLQSTVLQRLLI